MIAITYQIIEVKINLAAINIKGKVIIYIKHIKNFIFFKGMFKETNIYKHTYKFHFNYSIY